MTEKNKIKNISVAVVKDSTGNILVVKRRKKEAGIDGGVLSWVFPGGYIEAHEDALEAADRETFAETGYSVSPIKQISQRTFHEFGVNISYVECSLDSRKRAPIIEDDEVEDAKFVSPSELNKYFTTNLDLGVAKYLGLTL